MRQFPYLMALAAVALPAACSVPEGQLVDMSGGAQAAGGNTSFSGSSSTTGGAPSVGGTTSGGTSFAVGGSSTGGSTISAGGTQALGGTANSGGNTPSGGTVAFGGTAGATGGAPSVGGTSATGGAGGTAGTPASGGVISMGGTAANSGGFISTGGIKSGGGTTATGGTISTGGAPGTGGAIATGGMNPTGGASSTGGSPSTGGVSPATGGAATGGAATGGAPSTGGTATGGAATGGAGATCTKIDCANSACVNDVCVDQAPANWIGPIALYEGDPATIPACTAPFSSEVLTLNGNLTASSATCSSCSCSASAPYCGTDVYGSDTVADCNAGGGVTSLTFVNTKTGCVRTTAVNGYPAQSPFAAINGNQIGFSQIDCGPSPQTPTATVPTPIWSKAARGCALPFPGANGCGTGSVCSPAPEAPFNGKLCIYQTGDVACPSTGTYVVKRLYYGSLTDTRGCSDCSCTRIFGTGTNAILHVYSDTSCNTEVWAGVPPFGTCVSANGVSMNMTGTAAGGSCTVGGGQPTGTVTPTGQTTICCSP
jgi:hypothetical protein